MGTQCGRGLRNLRARISLKVTAQFIPELRLHNKKGPNECQLVETLGPKDPREAQLQ